MNNLRFMYIRDAKSEPIGCVAICINRKKNRVEYGLSMRNPKDAIDEHGKRIRFDRGVAKKLALHNLAWDHAETTMKRAFIPYDANMHDITSSVMRDIIAQGQAPNGAVKFAKRWLSSVEYYLGLRLRNVLP